MNKIVAISGFPGSGKTSVTVELSRRLAGSWMDYDRYQKITNEPVQEIMKRMYRDEEGTGLSVPGLAEDLQKLKNGHNVIEPESGRLITPEKYIFLETPLARLHPESGRYIDTVIWLDVPLDVALARNLRTFTGVFLQETEVSGHRKNLLWLSDYLSNYVNHVRGLLLLQHERVGKNADITINAEQGVDVVVSSVVKELGRIG